MALQGALITPFELVDVEGAGAYFPNRFPTPPTSWGYLIDLDIELTIDGITSVPLVGALVPEGSYLEPTTGQIWPR